MRGYVVSRGGTFGVVSRQYRNENGDSMLVIKHGPLQWVTPVYESGCHFCKSAHYSGALAEAVEWLEEGNK